MKCVGINAQDAIQELCKLGRAKFSARTISEITFLECERVIVLMQQKEQRYESRLGALDVCTIRVLLWRQA